MDKSSRTDILLQDQRDSWNRWNTMWREQAQGEVSKRQAGVVEGWLGSLGRKDLGLIDIGCGAGWLCERLLHFGKVTGTDLADEVLERAKDRLPQVCFVAGDFFDLRFEDEQFDVAIALEVLSHVADQPAFLRQIARLLKKGGLLMLATQNRPVLERWSEIGGPIPGQIRRWVDSSSLRQLLASDFELLEMTSVLPVGDQGLLRIVNSVKLNRLLSLLVPQHVLDRTKERLLLGHTLMACARRRTA